MTGPWMAGLIFGTGVVIVTACCLMARRSDRARAGRDVVTGCEDLCRAAASGLFAINPEENNPT